MIPAMAKARSKIQVKAVQGERLYRLSSPSGWLTDRAVEAEVDRRIDDLLAGRTKAISARASLRRLSAATRHPRGDR
jgi:hypothetical protein